MRLYTCSGEVYADGLSNGGTTRYFATKREAIASAIEHTEGSETEEYPGDEVSIERIDIGRVTVERAVCMLNHEGFCLSDEHIGVVRNGKILRTDTGARHDRP